MAAPTRGGDGQQPASSAGAIVAAVLLAVAGLLVGLVLGGGDGDPRTITVAETQTVTIGTSTTKTVTRTVTETVTEPADEFTDEGGTTSTDEASGEDCSDEYLGACVPRGRERVECSDLRERDFDSIGDDPYGLDPDGDGFACE